MITKKNFIEKVDNALSNVGEKVLRKSIINFSYYYSIGTVMFYTKSGRHLSFDRWSGVIKDVDIWNSVKDYNEADAAAFVANFTF